MAQIIQHPHAGNPPVVQTRKCGRLPLHITSLQRLRNDRSFAAYMERTRQEEISQTRAALAALEIGKHTLGYHLACLQQGASV